jgi:hypothetical protein
MKPRNRIDERRILGPEYGGLRKTMAGQVEALIREKSFLSLERK